MPAYRMVELFETADGRTFRRQTQAHDHVADLCREVLSDRLRSVLGDLTANDIYRVVMCLIPDVAAAEELANELSSKFVAD